MKTFISDSFLLKSSIAERLYHEFAKDMPIADYHCHLPPDQIAGDFKFKNLTEIWLKGDHYKWRAMRANGVDEKYITGNEPDNEKFRRWAETVPYTLRNPLYHWTHLELLRYFGVDELLDGKNAEEIYQHCSHQLQTEQFSVKNLLRKMKVSYIGTTDDPLDDLKHHQKIKNDGFEIVVSPSFRPDKAMAVDNLEELNTYIDKLEEVSNVSISSIDDYLKALKSRHDFFALNGCTVSDHGLEHIYAENYTEAEVKAVFIKVRNKQPINQLEIFKFKSAMLFNFALWNSEKGWVQQFHLGALRNNNSRKLAELGPDTGWDSIGDFSQAKLLAKFLNRLDSEDNLAKTIIYNLNPADNDMIAAMIGNFNDGTIAGKIQYGSAWWFLDQKDGMTKQINALSNIGLVSQFIGMITDSRSFLSFPRHEYFRRILCNIFAQDIENGELPNDINWIGTVIQNICYHNAKKYIGF